MNHRLGTRPLVRVAGCRFFFLQVAGSATVAALLAATQCVAGDYGRHAEQSYGACGNTQIALTLFAPRYLLFELFEQCYLSFAFAFDQCHNSVCFD